VEPFVQCSVEGCVAGSVGTATGRLWLQYEDLGEDPISGAVGLDRTYFRDGRHSAAFGPGWRSLLDTRLEERGGGWTLVGFPFLPTAPLEIAERRVTFADGTRWTFSDDGLLTRIIITTELRARP